MKRIISLLFTLTIFSSVLFAQQLSKYSLSLSKKLKNPVLQNREIAIFAQGDIKEIKVKTEEVGGVFKYAAGNIAAIHLPLNKVHEIAELKSVIRVEDNDMKLQPMNDRALVMNHVLEVQQGWNLPQGYDGTGVVVGIIDEGIDVNHPDFRDANGNTRIKFVWDQRFGPTNLSPSNYGYGREWVGSQVDTSVLISDGATSHGSHVTGTACGNGLACGIYKGVASNADIVVVKMDLDNESGDNFLTSLVDAVHYIFDKADALNEPASINVSLGTYFGSHDAKDIQAVAIDTLLSGQVAGGPGRSLSCAAGNAGAAPIHLGYDVSSDTAVTWFVAPYSPASNNEIYFDVWGDSALANVQFSIGIDRVLPDFAYLDGTSFFNVIPYLWNPGSDTLYSGANRLGIVQYESEYLHGAFHMEFLITPDSANAKYRWRLMTKGSGHLDAWGFDMVADNLPDTLTYPIMAKYKKPDVNQNIVSSFTCSDRVITVGSYVNRNTYPNSIFGQTTDPTLIPGKLSNFSSHGPTRDGRIKPDINATGEWVISCGSASFVNALAAVEPLKVAACKKHFRSSGTSMSSPVVAGIAALYLQKNPTATYAEVKHAILSCADEDAFTGSSLPDNLWGYGKANAYAAIHGCAVGIDEPGFNTIGLTNFPNPFTDYTTIHYDNNALSKFKNAELKICDLLGHEVMSFTLDERKNDFILSKSLLESGVYFYSVVADGKILKTNKLVVL